MLSYDSHQIAVGDLVVNDVYGCDSAGVYVRRAAGKTDGVSVAESIISVIGDKYGQEELDAENAEVEQYPLGPKEYWRGRLVGKARFGPDQHPMIEDEFESEWQDS